MVVVVMVVMIVVMVVVVVMGMILPHCNNDLCMGWWSRKTYSRKQYAQTEKPTCQANIHNSSLST
jgi:hypothetical protein